MTRNIFAAWIILFFVTAQVNGQSQTFFGVNLGITNDIYEIVDNGNNLKNVPLIQGLWGFDIRQDLNRSIFLETGLLRNHYDEGFGFNSKAGNSSTNAINAWIIPIRLGTKINLYSSKIYLVPVIGYSFCINSDYGAHGYGSGRQKTGNDSISYNYSDNLSLAKTFSLLQTGLGFEFKIFKRSMLSFSTNYYTGFKKIVQVDINYKINDSPVTTGKQFSKGEFWSFNFGWKYEINHFWIKRK